MVLVGGTPLELVAHEADRRSDPPKKTRRWLTGLRWKAATGVLGVGVALASLWTWWVPHYRPPLATGERFGIDVSNHQGDIDWHRVAHDDIHFAYIKATEGGDWIDQQFAANWAGAADAGINRGAYHFFTLCRPGTEQATNFLRTVPSDGELAPALDLELAGNCAGRPENDAVVAEVEAFIEAVEAATGRQVLLYIGEDFEDRYPIRERLDRPLWHRRWYRRPDVEAWLVWQFTGMAHVDGVDGDVDLNVMRPPPSQSARRSDRSQVLFGFPDLHELDGEGGDPEVFREDSEHVVDPGRRR